MKERMKWAYTFTLLLLTLLWAAFTVWVGLLTIGNPDALAIAGAMGASGLLGAMLTWNANVNQFWFRKKSPEPGG